MTGYQSKRAAAQDKLKCQCSLSTKLVGSGCQYCNPEYMDDADAQPAQEPVAWAVVGDGKFGEYELGQVFVDYEATHIYWKNRGYELVPVYTTPPQRQPLTDEQIEDIAAQTMFPINFARAIEAAHGIKENT